VLHVVATDQRRGAEMFAADLIPHLAESNVEQRVAVLRTTDGSSVRYGVPTSVLSSGGLLAPGVKLRLRSTRALAGLVRGWRPDIIQAHGGEALKYVALGVRAGNLRLVYRRIGARPESMAGARLTTYRLMMRRALRVVAVGEALRRETVEAFGVPPERVISIPNGVDLQRMEPTRERERTRRDLGIPPRAEVILSLGALSWEKDPLAHLEVSSRVLASRPRAFHLMVGDGPLRAAVEEGMAGLGLNGRARALGPREDVADLLAACDVLLQASRVEGMPGSVIEAGMLGVPVAAFALADIPEVVVDGETGRLAPVGDTHALAERVIEILASPERRAAMGRAALKRCRGRFDIRVVAPRYLEMYRQLAVGNGSTTPDRPGDQVNVDGGLD
jgi:glycosyltransferase involved in cell wall biosynthesis